MNYLIIILAIIVILLAYYIYTIVSAPVVLGKNIDLSEEAVVIKSSSISNPYSANYCTGVWVYIFNFTQNNKIDRFLQYGTSEHLGKDSLFSLRMDQRKPILYCDVMVNDPNMEKKYKPQTVQITSETNMFPLQKWVYVSVSVSNSFIECYLNGRFVIAKKVDDAGLYISEPPPGADIESGPTFRFGARGTKLDDGISVREKGCPIVLTGLSRWDAPLNAGDVYNQYMKGNGMERNSIWGPSYHMDINVKRGSNNYVLPVF
jgi:hypothetical protein